MRVDKFFHDPQFTRKVKTDLDGTLDKKSLKDRLVRLIQNVSGTITEISSQVHELKTYNEVINNSIIEKR